MTENGLIKLRTRVRQILWSECGKAFEALSFVHSGAGLFTRRATNEIEFGILVDVERTRGSVQVGTSLMIFHKNAAGLVSEGLRSTGMRTGEDLEGLDLALDVRSLDYLMAQANLPRPLLVGYPIFEESQAIRVATSIVDGVPLVAARYFSHGSSDPNLISYFESDKRAGGTSNQIKLMSLYVVTGRMDKLRDLMAKVSPPESAPMTVAFKEYLLERISRTKPAEN